MVNIPNNSYLSIGAEQLDAMANSGIALPLHVIAGISEGMQENRQDNAALLTHWLNTVPFPSSNDIGNLTASASDLGSVLSLSSDVVNSFIPLNNAYFSGTRLVNGDLNGAIQVMNQSYQQQQQNPLNNASLLTTSNSYLQPQTFSGTFQDDFYIGGVLNDTLSGGFGDDTLYGSSGNDRLSGNYNDDFLNGGSGNDVLLGGTGDDLLQGDEGHDILLGYGGGREYDTLTGGLGTDTFVLGDSSEAFYQGNGYATITDFNYLADYIQVMGSASQYSLQTVNWEGLSWKSDTAIYRGSDLVGIVQDTTNVNFSRDFIFA